ncbi:MAG: shikimate kinase [Ginsengibacter sp.]
MNNLSDTSMDKKGNSPFKIFLIGFMGSGKSHWGRIWASKIGIPFYDLDERIEEGSGIKITNIFETEGEEKFRELESYHLKKFDDNNNFLLACGGGTPCFCDNIEWMKSQGKVFYLKSKPELIVKRLFDETTHRPVIKNLSPAELLPFVQNKLVERERYYLQAHHVLNVEDLDESSLSFFIRKP